MLRCYIGHHVKSVSLMFSNPWSGRSHGLLETIYRFWSA